MVGRCNACHADVEVSTHIPFGAVLYLDVLGRHSRTPFNSRFKEDSSYYADAFCVYMGVGIAKVLVLTATDMTCSKQSLNHKSVHFLASENP
jgi:hypothetical protein